MSDPRRSLPSVSVLLETEEVRSLIERHPRALVVNAIRDTLDELRAGAAGEGGPGLLETIAERVERAALPSLTPVFNLTGIVLHTNLGRAPLANVALDAVLALAGGYSNLEYDLDTGRRGSRYSHCVSLLCGLTGAEDAIVVNNCAAALVLTLSALARGREVIVSRGELVEIGGSFRVPDIMGRSGATLVEVGTTNRTHLDDYVRAITPRTGAIAKIHRSNFTIEGFVADVGVSDLVPVAGEHDIPIIHDLGSGLIIPLDEFGLSGEPTAHAALTAGATVVTMSGDKLLGGPQAGIIVGKAHAIARLKKDPFARALRVDKMTIAALGATLQLYRDPERALAAIPTLAMITAPVAEVRERASTLARALRDSNIDAEVVPSRASVGAGAFPTREIPSAAVTINGDATALEQKLRSGSPPVIGRIADDRLILDMRSVPAAHDSRLTSAILRALA
ncbi:MAG TPA: L-seryl-tRNA(Sec) selenium transferase [Gemmatimonadaceae bacterium]|nr:L-seryl-tRNA(Sec) selenium transferase [Gemmatimonadaceae bacterium]